MNSTELEGITLLDGQGFRALREGSEMPDTLAVLVITADSRLLPHMRHMKALRDGTPSAVVAVTDEDCHHVPVLRLPRVMLYSGGERVANELVNMESESVADALRRLNLL